MEIDFNYKKNEIPQDLINECNLLSDKTGEIQFIFDTETTNIIKSMGIWSTGDKRDFIIDSVFDDDVYHIGDSNLFTGMPTRWSYYDTETRLIDRYQRYNYVKDYIIDLGFEYSITNLGPEYEQSFIIELSNNKWILRLTPNLFIKITHEDYQNQFPPNKKNIFNGFFNKSIILESLKNSNKDIFLSISRNKKLSELVR
jgi:hypothetical protein